MQRKTLHTDTDHYQKLEELVAHHKARSLTHMIEVLIDKAHRAMEKSKRSN